MQIDKSSPSFAGDGLHGSFDCRVTVTTGRAENVAHEAMRVHPNQNRFAAVFNVTANQRDMGFAAIHFAFVRDQPKFAVTRGHERLSDPVDVTLVLHAVTDQLGYGQHFQTVGPAKVDQVRNPRHGAVIAHDFADHSCWNHSREPCQVHGSFGLAGAHQHPTFTSSQGKNVSRTCQIRGASGGIDSDADGAGTIVGRNSSSHSLARIDGFTECSSVIRSVLGSHRTDAQMIEPVFG